MRWARLGSSVIGKIGGGLKWDLEACQAKDTKVRATSCGGPGKRNTNSGSCADALAEHRHPGEVRRANCYSVYVFSFALFLIN